MHFGHFVRGTEQLLSSVLPFLQPPQQLHVHYLAHRSHIAARMEQRTPAIQASSRSSSREYSPSEPLQHQAEDAKDVSMSAAPAGAAGPTSADSVKEEGLRAFRAGDWRGATDAWSRGLRTLEYILAKEDEFDENKKKEFVAMQQSYLLNLSLSTLKEGRWAVCIIYCDKALHNDPNSLKALYRKAQAQQELGEFDAALATVERYLKVAPGSPLAVSLQEKLRHQKAAHAIREKKLLQGMFRNLEHSRRSEASAAPATAAETKAEGGLLQFLSKKVAGWLSGSSRKVPSEAYRQKQPQQDLWKERVAPLNGAWGPGVGWPPPAGGGATGDAAAAGDMNQQAALQEALAALGSSGQLDPSVGGGLDLEQLSRLIQMHQQLSSGNASLKDKFLFGLRLAWFGVKQFLLRGCGYFCRRRRTPQMKKDEFKRETKSRANVAPRSEASSEGHDAKPFVSRSLRRQQARSAAAAAARKRVQQRGVPSAVKRSSRIEDLDELEARES